MVFLRVLEVEMQVESVHSRRIDAPPDKVGVLLDELGSDGDRLWAKDRWPADMRIRFDLPLRVGARGGHGTVRYSIEEYEPGRRLGFRFDGPGLVGGHSLEVTARDDGAADLVHRLEGRVEGATRVTWPLIERMHDAYVEDIFDCAEQAATGRVERPARQPRWLRAMNAVSMRLDRWRPPTRLVRAAGVAVPVLLGGAAAIHAAWAAGWRWPGGSDTALAERVVGPGAELPSAALTMVVAAALVVAAGAVRLAATSTNQGAQVVTWLVALALTARGALYVPVDLLGGMDDIYEKLDLAIYSPLCLLLGMGAAVVAQGSRSRTTAGE